MKQGRVSDSTKYLLAAGLLVAFLVLVGIYFFNAACPDLPGMEDCQRVLFIGNSFTFANDLPHEFAALAHAGGHRVLTGMSAQGGWTLADHLASAATLGQLNSSHWNFVVLQEQSEIPAVPQSRLADMYPAARQLVGRIHASGATALFFLTWAHRDGLPAYGLPDYQSMQLEIDRGYLGIAQELKVPVAPVGYAWLIASAQDSRLSLWQVDGSHPSLQGTYLAACVFYAVIFHQSPAGLPYLGQLPPELARELQSVAATTVLNNPQQWNLP